MPPSSSLGGAVVVGLPSTFRLRHSASDVLVDSGTLGTALPESVASLTREFRFAAPALVVWPAEPGRGSIVWLNHAMRHGGTSANEPLFATILINSARAAAAGL